MNLENTTILVPYKTEEFMQILTQIIRAELLKIHKTGSSDPMYVIPPLQEKTFYSTKDIMQIFKVSRQTVHDWSKQGKLPKHKVHKYGRVFYLKSDVEKLIGISQGT